MKQQIQNIRQQVKTIQILIMFLLRTAIVIGRSQKIENEPEPAFIHADSVKIWVETAGLGHVWLSVGSDENLTVYSYGNYAAAAGASANLKAMLPSRGVMLRLKGAEANDFIQQKIVHSGASAYLVQDVIGEDVRQYCDSLFFSSQETPKTGKYKRFNGARMVLKYNLLRYNCTTFAITAVTKAKSKLFFQKDGRSRVKNLIAPAWAQSFLKKKSAKQEGFNDVVLLGDFGVK
jgi:hypothetical protein